MREEALGGGEGDAVKENVTPQSIPHTGRGRMLCCVKATRLFCFYQCLWKALRA